MVGLQNDLHYVWTSPDVLRTLETFAHAQAWPKVDTF
jgi:hypothetical protein